MGRVKVQNILATIGCLLLVGLSHQQRAKWEACQTLCGDVISDYSEEIAYYPSSTSDEWPDNELIQQPKWIPPPLHPLRTQSFQANLVGRNVGGSFKIKSQCKYYKGNISSVCWSHGCQYYVGGKGKCVEGKMSCEVKSYDNCICSHSFCDHLNTRNCTPEPNIFENKLSCRRANTYYVYHPKQHCHSKKASGDCTATVTHAVNFNGPELTDQGGIWYMAEKDSRYKDPLHLRRETSDCNRIQGISHKDTVELYRRAIVGRDGLAAGDKCVGYPVPICQTGEYMLTIKLMEDFFQVANEKCTEVRINNIPVMIHLDPFTLSGNKKCGAADVVIMFVAASEEGDFDSDPKSVQALYLKGHIQPISVLGGEIELQFCYGYDCKDDNYIASAFSLERLGNGTQTCKLADQLTPPPSIPTSNNNNSTKT